MGLNMVKSTCNDITEIHVLEDIAFDENSIEIARRTAFIARFIVLREGKRTKAHRIIEKLTWDEDTTAEELAETIREIFVSNGDNMENIDRDLVRSFAHASRSITFFIKEYLERSTVTFIEALEDYELSNSLLFTGEEQPKPGGWRLPIELKKEVNMVN